MLTRSFQTAYLCTVLLALPGFTQAAQEQPAHAAAAAVEHRVATRDGVHHAAAAKRFEQEAERYEQDAARHEREAAEFRGLAPRAPKGTITPK